jgi:hypothetical protein
MVKLNPAPFTVAVAVATLTPAASASAGLPPRPPSAEVFLNHNNTLLLDA